MFKVFIFGTGIFLGYMMGTGAITCDRTTLGCRLHPDGAIIKYTEAFPKATSWQDGYSPDRYKATGAPTPLHN